MTNIFNQKGLGLLIVLTFVAPSAIGQSRDIESMLQEFAEDYKKDHMAISATFGIQIGEDWWHVHATRKQEAYSVKGKYTFHNFGPHEVTLHKGKAEEPTWYFKLADRSVLDNIYTKFWSATTAAMRGMPSDVVALDMGFDEGFIPSRQIEGVQYQTLEHFWKMGAVEITTFTRDASLPTHGVGAVSLYTMKDKRIAWFSISKEEAANDDPRMEQGQVPNLFIITKGRGRALLADGEVMLEPGMSIFVPAYTKHVIFNPYDEPLEGILVLFGDNIDFALGQSYSDFLDAQYEFLGKNEQQGSN